MTTRCFRSVRDSFTAERARVTFGLVKGLWLVFSSGKMCSLSTCLCIVGFVFSLLVWRDELIRLQYVLGRHYGLCFVLFLRDCWCKDSHELFWWTDWTLVIQISERVFILVLMIKMLSTCPTYTRCCLVQSSKYFFLQDLWVEWSFDA